ncbi:MAG: hypothetical protein DDT31_00199 [Syntrophomonadaceae bacterium]|nr:hypothetical protein [Bacillota bacterium]
MNTPTTNSLVLNSDFSEMSKHTVHLTEDQFALITALVAQCRLGQPSPYSTAAFEICEMVNVMRGDNYCSDACNKVNLDISIENADGEVVFSVEKAKCYSIFEV